MPRIRNIKNREPTDLSIHIERSIIQTQKYNDLLHYNTEGISLAALSNRKKFAFLRFLILNNVFYDNNIVNIS